MSLVGGFSMYYFSFIGNKIEKYEIDFDRKKLLQLREEIILNCSEIHHKEFEGVVGPKMDHLKIKNFSKIKVGVKESRNNCGPDQSLYYFSYDENEYPYLVTLIDRLLNGDIVVIDEFFNINLKKEKLPFQYRIEILLEEVSKISDMCVQEKIQKLLQLQEMIELSELNKNQKSVFEYYYKVRDYIYIEYIGEIEMSEWNHIQKFMGIDSSDLYVQIPKKLVL